MAVLLSNRQRKVKVDLDALRQSAAQMMKALDLEGAELSICLVNDEEIKTLNKRYRQREETTDVLAFPMQGGESRGWDQNLLGDIVISPESAYRQAESQGHSLTEELNLLLAHGLLHLLGYDHGEAMSEKEEELLQRIRNP